MFEGQIQHARDFIRRIHLCSERGLDVVPKAEWVSGVDECSWYTATEGLIGHAFGVDSKEMRRYRSTIDARRQLLDAVHARGDPKWDLTYWIEHYHQMIGLLQEFEAKYLASQSERQPHNKEIVMGDKYVTGQAGAVGPGAQAHQITFTQLWSQVESDIPLNRLGPELALLRKAMKNEATGPEQDVAIGAVAAAEQAANNGSGPKTLELLRSAGKWGLEVAEKIGVGVATAAIKSALGL